MQTVRLHTTPVRGTTFICRHEPSSPVPKKLMGSPHLVRLHNDGTMDTSVPASAFNLWLLKEAGFEFEEDAEALYRRMFNLDAVEHRPLPTMQPGFSLLPYQAEGIRFIEKRRGRAIVGDEMGLGKSLQVLAWLQMYPENRLAVIVCPAHLQYNWLNEYVKFFGESAEIEVLRGMRPYRIVGTIVILNYNIVAAWMPYLVALKPSVFVADEAHFVKHAKAKRTKAATELSTCAQNVLLLSGTPIENNVLEIWGLSRMVEPCVMPGHFTYKQEYAELVRKPYMKGGAIMRRRDGTPIYRMVVRGGRALNHLHRVLTSTIMVRRRKADVLKELPQKVHHVVPFEISRAIYGAAERDVVKNVKLTRKVSLTPQEHIKYTALFASLRQVAAVAKLAQSVEWIGSFLEETDRKLIIIAHHKLVIRHLRDNFTNSLVIDGTVKTSQEKMANAHTFQNDPSRRVIIGEVSAIGTGYTLTAASDVLFVELPDKPSTLDQAIDRAHRIGQFADQVDIWYHIAQDTIESDIMKFLDTKRGVMRGVLDGVAVQQEELLEYLVRCLSGRM